MIDLDQPAGCCSKIAREPSVGQQEPDLAEPEMLLVRLAVAGATTDCRDLRIGVRLKEPLEPVGFGVGVVVDEGDDLLACAIESDRPRGRGVADPAGVASVLHARMPRHDAARKLVGRGVDDDDARGGDGLSLEVGGPPCSRGAGTSR